MCSGMTTFVCMYAMEGPMPQLNTHVAVGGVEEGEITDAVCMSSHHTDQKGFKFPMDIAY